MAWKTYHVRTTETIVRTYEIKAQSRAHAMTRIEEGLTNGTADPIEITSWDEEVRDWPAPVKENG